MTQIVITGATGFLGGALVDRLTRGGAGENGAGADVIALTRSPAPALTALGIDVRVGSLLDAGWLQEQIPRGAHVVHLAGRVAFDEAASQGLYELHVEATRTVCHAALRQDAERVVVVSSSGTTAVSRQEYLHTESDRHPVEIIARWPYYQSKMVQERLVLDLARREGLPAVVLCPSLLLGPGDDRGSSTELVTDFMARRISFVPGGGISVVDVRDVAAAVISALSAGRAGERYLLGSLNCRFSTFFQMLERCTGVPAPTIPAPRAVAALGSRLLRRFAPPERAAATSPAKAEMASYFWYVDWTKASNELDFEPRRPEQTVRDTAAYLSR